MRSRFTRTRTTFVRRLTDDGQRDLRKATARATVRLEDMFDVVLAAPDRFDPRPLHAGQLELEPLRQLELEPKLELVLTRPR